MKMRGTLPGDNLLQTRGGVIKVMGTSTAWDQQYFARSITRRMSFAEGYSMEFEAQNFTTNEAPIEQQQ
jgi:hypothetical protein